ncbi:MAG: type II toxin-antitoxin system RelE/ParE family toxin [Phycisphaera sp.]|nr:MAG: type II toxin-antitoxin system RelE/ParE family toxin [Phycisphaera sp.]
MSYRMAFSSGVHDAIADQTEYLLESGAGEAVVTDWLARLHDKLQALREYPRLYPRAELVSRAKGYGVHRLNHGEHALFYRIDDDRRVVEVLDFRHGRRKPTTEIGA